MNRNITLFTSVILAFALFFTYAISGSTALAQNQSSSTNSSSSSSNNASSTPQNQTSATVTGQVRSAM